MGRVKEVHCDISKGVEHVPQTCESCQTCVCVYVCAQRQMLLQAILQPDLLLHYRRVFPQSCPFLRTQTHRDGVCVHIKQRSAEEKNQRAMRRNKTKSTTHCSRPRANLAAFVNKTLLLEVCDSHKKASIAPIFSYFLSFCSSYFF